MYRVGSQQFLYALPLGTESYRRFLSDFGSIAVGDNGVSGIDNADPLALKGGTIYGDTLFMRDDFKDQYEVPEHLWVLVKHEDGAYCFNFNVKTDEDEYAIVNYEPYLPPKTFEEPVARTFHEFLVKRFFNYLDD